MSVEDICREHCTKVVEDCNVEPDESLYAVTWEACMRDCYKIANAILLGLGKAVVEICEDRDNYVEDPIEPWVLSCVKTYLSMLSYYSDLVIAIIDRMFTRYEKVFKALWEKRSEHKHG